MRWNIILYDRWWHNSIYISYSEFDQIRDTMQSNMRCHIQLDMICDMIRNILSYNKPAYSAYGDTCHGLQHCTYFPVNPTRNGALTCTHAHTKKVARKWPSTLFTFQTVSLQKRLVHWAPFPGSNKCKRSAQTADVLAALAAPLGLIWELLSCPAWRAGARGNITPHTLAAKMSDWPDCKRQREHFPVPPFNATLLPTPQSRGLMFLLSPFFCASANI